MPRRIPFDFEKKNNRPVVSVCVWGGGGKNVGESNFGPNDKRKNFERL